MINIIERILAIVGSILSIAISCYQVYEKFFKKKSTRKKSVKKELKELGNKKDSENIILDTDSTPLTIPFSQVNYKGPPPWEKDESYPERIDKKGYYYYEDEDKYLSNIYSKEELSDLKRLLAKTTERLYYARVRWFNTYSLAYIYIYMFFIFFLISIYFNKWWFNIYLVLMLSIDVKNFEPEKHRNMIRADDPIIYANFRCFLNVIIGSFLFLYSNITNNQSFYWSIILMFCLGGGWFLVYIFEIVKQKISKALGE